jgi:hypothetical protein
MKISRQEKRSLLIGGILLGCIFLMRFFFIPFIQGWGELNNELKNIEGKIERAQLIILDEDKYRTRLSEAQEDLISASRWFFCGTEAYGASLEMLELIDGLAKRSNIEVQAKNVETLKNSGDIVIISVLFTITGYIEEVFDFLKELEMAKKIYSVDALDIRNEGHGHLRVSATTSSLFFLQEELLLTDTEVSSIPSSNAWIKWADKGSYIQGPIEWLVFTGNTEPSTKNQGIPFEVEGIVYSSTSQAALLVDKAKGIKRVVKVGDEIEGIEVLKVDKDYLVLKADSKKDSAL